MTWSNTTFENKFNRERESRGILFLDISDDMEVKELFDPSEACLVKVKNSKNCRK
jgi:hypothetical protein